MLAWLALLTTALVPHGPRAFLCPHVYSHHGHQAESSHPLQPTAAAPNTAAANTAGANTAATDTAGANTTAANTAATNTAKANTYAALSSLFKTIATAYYPP